MCHLVELYSLAVVILHVFVIVVHELVLRTIVRIWLRRLHVADTARVPIAHLAQDVLVRVRGRVLAEDPRVAHNLIAVQTLVRVGDQELTDEIFRFRRNGGPWGRVEVILAALDLLKQGEVVLVVERWRSWEQNEENDSHAPEIAPILVRLLREDLGRHVSRRTARRRRQLLLVDEARQTEIRHLNDRRGEILLREEQILRLDIPVNDAKSVAVDQCVKDGRNDISSLSLREPLFLQDLIKQLDRETKKWTGWEGVHLHQKKNIIKKMIISKICGPEEPTISLKERNEMRLDDFHLTYNDSEILSCVPHLLASTP